jgi:outer membrane protein TolC
MLAAALVIGSGCAVDQEADVRAYREIVDIAPPPEWESVTTLSLIDALRFANAFNEELAIEGENYVQALADRQRASSSLFPTVDVFGNFTFRDSGGSEGSGNNSGSTLFDAGIGGQYTLLTGMTDINRVEASRLSIEQRRWLLLDLRESLLLATARAYYTVMLSERLVAVLESSLQVQEERLRDARGRQDVGFARPLDVAQIEAQASVTRVSLLDARNLVSNSRSALTLLTSIDCTSIPLSDAYELPPPVASLEELLAIALTNRQDLGAAALAASASRVTVDAEIGRYFPTVTLNLDYFLTRDTLPTEREWAGLLTVNLPIFTAGRIDSDVRAAWSVFRQDVLRHSLTRRQIRRDIETAYSEVSVTAQRITELGNQLRAAEESLRQAEASYSAGLGTNLERIASQDAVLSAQVGLAREEYSYKVAYLAAMRAAGVLASAIDGREIRREPLPAPPESAFVNLPPAGPASEEERRAEDR